MPAVSTFVDAGVLLVAFQGRTSDAVKALTLLEDPNREFASSLFLKLEVLPQAMYHHRQTEIRFYNAFFDKVVNWASVSEQLVQDALLQASNYGLHAMDALHVAAARQTGSVEIVTTEKLTKPIHRTVNMKIVPLASLR